MKRLLSALASTVRSNVPVAGVLLLCSVLLGLVPVVKSILESALIATIDRQLRDDGGPANWQMPLDLPAASEDRLEQATAKLFVDASLIDGLGFYLAVIGLGVLVAMLAAWSRGKLGAEFFRRLYAAALTRALGSRGQPEKAVNLSGQQTSALQQGASALSATAAASFSAAQLFVAVVSSSAVLFTLDERFLILFLIIVVVLSCLSYLQARRLNARREQLDERRNELSARADDVLKRRELILTHERQEHYREGMDIHALALTDIKRRLTIGEQLFDSLSGGVRDAGLILILALALFTVAGSPPAEGSAVAGAYFFISLYTRLSYNFRGLLSYFDDARRSLSQSRTFLSMLQEPDPPTPVNVVSPMSNGSAPAVQFEDVGFAYDQSRQVLSSCSFVVPAGGMTLLVGPSGAGKTTIARLILGFLDPNDGQVLVQGVPTTAYDRAELWARLSYLPQHGHVLDESVRENLFAVSQSDAELITALEAVGLSVGYGEAILDRRAADLSLGEQQRLAVARLLLDRAPVVVMDEPFAGVDAFTFRDLRGRIEAFLCERSRTLIVISHRMAFAGYARHAIVLDGSGGVIEAGPPADLLSAGRTFADLFKTALAEVKMPGSVSVG